MRLSLIVAVGTVLASATVSAQQPTGTGPRTPEALRSLHLAGRNVLGILQYCQAQGLSGAEAAERQRDLLRRAPPAEVPGLDDAEAAGRQGIVAFLDSRVPVAVVAQAEGVTVATRCRYMELGLGVP